MWLTYWDQLCSCRFWIALIPLACMAHLNTYIVYVLDSLQSWEHGARGLFGQFFLNFDE